MKKPLKRYGRTRPNKLDGLLAIVCVVISVAAIWISIGISIANAGDVAGSAFGVFGKGLGCQLNVADGKGAIISAIIMPLFYASLLLMVLGIVGMAMRKHNDRMPGMVAQFVAVVGFCVYLSFVYAYNASGRLAGFWTTVLLVFAVILLGLAIFSTYFALTFPVDEPVQEAVVEKEPEPKEPLKFDTQEEPEPEPEPEPEAEPQSEPEPEPEPEPVPEEEDEEDEAEEEEDGDANQVDFFDTLGKRRKRVPFENKIRRASPETRALYRQIVSALREYNFNDRKSIPGETFSYKKTRCIFITMAGKTLKVHFKLDPKEFENSPIPMKDASDTKRYEDIPAYLRVKSGLAAKRTIALAERIANENNVPKKK